MTFGSNSGVAMKFVKTLLLGLFCLALASAASADPGCVYITYENLGGNAPLGCPCENTAQHPYAEGTPVCIYWDNNANGPDTSDHQPVEGDSIGQVNFNCMTINDGPGYFISDPYFCVSELPTAPDNPVYYLQVTLGVCCWQSDTFSVQPGVEDVLLTQANWHCVNSPCGGGGTVPNAPTNFTASDDALCLAVSLSWQHDGQNVRGFNVYSGGAIVASFGAAQRSAEIAVFTDQVRSYSVRAYNALGESTPSNSDNGSTYQLRFANGPSGNLVGTNLHGTQFTVQFERPSPQCFSAAQLWLLVNNQPYVLLCRDSLVTSLTCTLPDDTTLNHCRLLLRDSSLIYAGVLLTDTTDSVFHLGIPSGLDDHVALTPDRFELGQNFPNPFNPETEIMFSVPSPSNVRIGIYNIMGQRVRTLTDAPYSMGVHRVRWDGRSDAGVAVGAGVYICRMEAPGFVQARKMLLLK
jgi:hypothetical protein